MRFKSVEEIQQELAQHPLPPEGVWISRRGKKTPQDLHSQLRQYLFELRNGHTWCSACFRAVVNPEQEYATFTRIPAAYGFVQGLPVRCKQHKTHDMEHVAVPRCQKPECDKFIAQFNGEPYCVAHGGGIRCASCTLYSVPKQGFLCWTCRKGTQRIKQYENMVEEFLQRGGIDDSQDERLGMWSLRDQKIPCADHQRRPDFVWCLEKHLVVLEVDEHAHRYYNTNCERYRLIQLLEAFECKPYHVVRLNPTNKAMTRLKETLLTLFQLPPERPIQLHFLGYPEGATYELWEE